MTKTSTTHFKPNYKPVGYRSPHWVITNYFAKIRTRFVKQITKTKVK